MYMQIHFPYRITCLIFPFLLIILFTGTIDVFAQNWPQWRGPLGTGACLAENPPVEWNEDKNIKWKTEIPGKGYSTPIIWDDQIFLTSTIETEEENKTFSWLHKLKFWGTGEETIQSESTHQFVVLSINRRNGHLIWKKKVREEVPLVRTHVTGSWASHSMVTDGEHLYAYFGSHGLYCLNLQGNILWERDFGKMDKDEGFGEGSTPVLYKDNLVIQRDHQGQSKLIVLNKKTGNTVYEVNRDANTSWSSPLVVEVLNHPQVITTETNWVRSYDLHSGQPIWECSGLSGYPIPTPIAANGIIFVMNGYQGHSVSAIRPAMAKGDITGSKSVIWQYTKSAPYTPSALLVENLLYFLKDERGRLTCLDANTGHELYFEKRLRGTGYILASPVGTKEQIYIVGQKGKTYVIRHGPEFEVLAVNDLDDEFAASPAIVDNCLFLRGTKYLYCISRK
jgi:outer membrane protein assembly factor BamB